MRQKTFCYIKSERPLTRVPKVGDKVVLISYEKEGGDAVEWGFTYDLEGVGGNMDSSIKELYGWRGTTCGIAKYAHGIRKVLKVTEYEEDGLEWVKVTVGKDLAPNKQ